MGYNEIIGKLNKQQRHAATNIEGPYLMLAGPGTGKTHTIGARIATMLKSEQMIGPETILALTYTDAGAHAMRERLLKMVGPESYRITILTFHALCNEIIQSNEHIFGIKDLEPASDLEIITVIKQIIDELPYEHPLTRVKGDKYYEVYRLKNLFGIMKKENWPPTMIEKAVKEYLDDLPTREEYIYKRNGKDYKKGDVKVKLIEEQKERMKTLVQAAYLLQAYNKKMREKSRYDFDDMIMWVIQAWKENENLLLNYQERYHYVLVDEFQDTSGIQFELLNMLLSYWEKPNVFAVADEDQTLYEFQGARMENMKRYIEDYAPTTYYLVDNYRSTQTILDLSNKFITNNQIRFKKDRLISNTKDNTEFRLIELANTQAEEEHARQLVSAYLKKGIPPSEIAVLYRKHRQGDNVIKLLKDSQIPVNVKRSVNVLEQPIVIHFINVLRYLTEFAFADENARNYGMFALLHYPYFNTDITALHNEFIQKKQGETMEKWNRVWAKEYQEFISQRPLRYCEHLFQKYFLPYIVRHKNRVKLNLYMGTLFDWIKSEVFKDPFITYDKIYGYVDDMIREGIALNILDIDQNEKGVTCSTVHGAKGLEWQVVIMIGLIRSQWEKGRGASGQYSLPDTLTRTTEENKEEVSRRLFYVGMTRAKKTLVLTYSKKDHNGRDAEMSQFCGELETEPLVRSLEKPTEYLESINSPEVELLAAEKEYIQEKVKKMTLSISAANKYTKCGRAFYYENVIQAPFVASEALVYGNAIHEALRFAYTEAMKQEQVVKKVIERFDKHLDNNAGQLDKSNIEKRRRLGHQVLTEYMTTHYLKSNKIVLTEYRAKVTIDEVPFVYIFDKMEFDGNAVMCVDYKTGKAGYTKKSAKSGDYFNQMVAAKIVLDNMHYKPWKHAGSKIELLDTGLEEIPIVFDNNDEKEVYKMITDAWAGIQQLKFDHRCNECYWCGLENLE